MTIEPTRGYYIVAHDESTDGEPLFIAIDPDLPGCMAHGATSDEAVANLTEARRLYLEDLPMPLLHSRDGGDQDDPVVVSTSASESASSIVRTERRELAPLAR